MNKDSIVVFLFGLSIITVWSSFVWVAVHFIIKFW